MPHIDLNCDLGESFGAYTIGMDEKVIPFITSANVACGFHAGDPLVMQRTVALCKQSGAAVGAHPGFPDLQGFGRRQMKLTPAEAQGLCAVSDRCAESVLRCRRCAAAPCKAPRRFV